MYWVIHADFVKDDKGNDIKEYCGHIVELSWPLYLYDLDKINAVRTTLSDAKILRDKLTKLIEKYDLDKEYDQKILECLKENY